MQLRESNLIIQPRRELQVDRGNRLAVPASQ